MWSVGYWFHKIYWDGFYSLGCSQLLWICAWKECIFSSFSVLFWGSFFQPPYTSFSLFEKGTWTIHISSLLPFRTTLTDIETVQTKTECTNEESQMHCFLLMIGLIIIPWPYKAFESIQMMTTFAMWFLLLNEPLRCHPGSGWWWWGQHREGTHTNWCGYSLSPPSQNPRIPLWFPPPLPLHTCSVWSSHCLKSILVITLNAYIIS